MAWYPKYQSCQQFFVNYSQHTRPVQAVAARVNILLPFERASSRDGSARDSSDPMSSSISGVARVTLVPYIRRLVVTGFDDAATLQGFFGDDWKDGISSIHVAERRNYLFAAKSDPWLKVKAQYDMENGQTVPFLRPLTDVTESEIISAETNWSDWLAMQDWMLGPRAPLEEN
ncbi:hypothetical protein E4U42_003758 [Claviceps africana]|uniref:Uncharacterized protein n=1 Tax=Claviceps africana TaxID=83212 RepID=A0A8K0J6D5_9HYPO|nr:hypothetical protein E4U42_003758 [Claviceps africana]